MPPGNGSMKAIRTILSAFLILLLCSYGLADLEVDFLDVGQGDAALLVCDGESMLIDGGPASASQLVYTFLREKTEYLNAIVATHPHDDHIGGLPAALNAVPVGVIYSPVSSWDSPRWAAIEQYAELQGTPIIVPVEGEVFSLGGADVTVLHCWPEAWTENDMSIVLRVDYGDVSFLFTGDAEDLSEYMMLDAEFAMPEEKNSLDVDVLKVGHHGSSTSSTPEFIEAVSPDIAVISCETGNPYHHPHAETLLTLEAADVEVLRTDELGTITIRTDGVNVDVSTMRTAPEQSGGETAGETGGSTADADHSSGYIGNCNSMKFHYPYCVSVLNMSDKNKVAIGDRETAIAMGYEPCGICRP